MNFSFTDEQCMLRDTAEAFLAAVSDSAAVRRAMVSPHGFDSELWQRLCDEMYWQGILVPESCDGLDLGMVEMAIAFEQLGRRLTPSPLFASALSTIALRTLEASPARDALLAAVARGETISLAHTAARDDWDTVSVEAIDGGSGWTLSGEARFVSCGSAAEHLLVAARCDQQELLFVVDPSAEGVTLVKTPTMDQTRPMTALRLDGVSLPPTGLLSGDWSQGRRNTLNIGRILVGAEQVGCAQESLDSSVAYVGERVQFGRTIASYQAIKHKAADMMLKVESARSLLYFAACVADDWLAGAASDGELAEAASMLASSAGDAAFFCAGCGIQLHGGVGITEEYDIQLYFKRARALESYLGRPDEHRELIAQMLLEEGDCDAA
ncbi:MAG: acyl-CoA dehydrogenase family protein [Halieaceae bacterium]